jgi:hypothetical protein
MTCKTHLNAVTKIAGLDTSCKLRVEIDMISYIEIKISLSFWQDGQCFTLGWK